MEVYQKAKMPPPVPPKYNKFNSSSNLGLAFENTYCRKEKTTPVASGALIQTNGMRVKIQINADSSTSTNGYRANTHHHQQQQQQQTATTGNSLRININGAQAHHHMMVTSPSACDNCTSSEYNKNVINTFDSNSKFTNISSKYINANSGSYFYNSSGQSSPSDNLDSGTCSDVDAAGSPPPPSQFIVKKKNKSTPPPLPLHHRCGSLNSSGIGMDSEDEDNVSCDSINSSEFTGENENTLPIISAAILKCNNTTSKVLFQQSSMGKADLEYKSPATPVEHTEIFDDAFENTDQYLHFHLNEKNFDVEDTNQNYSEEDSFAGFKSLMEKNIPVTTIHSARGTVRGVKNRVRAGIATFLNNNTTKTWQEKETGKIVVYTTTMGIVRETYHRCLKVRQILRTHLVKFEEKDVFMSREVQKEIRERMKTDDISVPQIFVEGMYIGDAEAIERLNESGELRKILKPYRSADALSTCQVCGGYRLLPCNVCNGSKKSIRRPNFTIELVPLKCMNCDEVGLIKCYAC